MGPKLGLDATLVCVIPRGTHPHLIRSVAAAIVGYVVTG